MENQTSNDAKQPTKTRVPEKLLERLLDFEPVPAPVISLYLDARADQHGQQNFLPFVRKQLSERCKSYESQSDERLAALSNGLDQRAVGGVGALLRYRISNTKAFSATDKRG